MVLLRNNLEKNPHFFQFLECPITKVNCMSTQPDIISRIEFRLIPLQQKKNKNLSFLNYPFW